MTRHKYDNQVGPDNAYGHTLDLLGRHLGPREGRVHLDLACGLAPIAPFVVDDHDLDYVGLDYDEASVAEIRERGFEAHTIDLNSTDLRQALDAVVGDRRVASVTMLDGLEHLVAGEQALAAIAGLLRDHQALGVLSVPNVTHQDLATKLLLGQWDYTETGLLDRTHVRLYSPTSLTETLREAGLAVIDTFDVVLPQSDQHFPAGHVALDDSTPIGQFLRDLRDGVDAHGTTNQFIWAVWPAPTDLTSDDADPSESAPFLTALVRTAGRDAQALRETMVCLGSQSDPDLEVVVIAVGLDTRQLAEVEEVLGDQPDHLDVRLVVTDAITEGAAYNAGLDVARGNSIASFDAGDLVLGTWVARLREAAGDIPWRVLRNPCVTQASTIVEIRGRAGVRATGSPRAVLPARFSLSQHTAVDGSPGPSWAWPRSLSRDFGVRYDDTLATGARWELLVRCAQLAGVADHLVISSVHRDWDDAAPAPDAARELIGSRPLLLAAHEAGKVAESLSEAQAAAQLREELRVAREHVAHLEGVVVEVRGAADEASRLQDEQITRLRRKLKRARSRSAAGSTTDDAAARRSRRPGRRRAQD